MSDIVNFLETCDTPSKFSKKYFSYLYKVLSNINDSEIDNLVELLDLARNQNKNIFIIGNGGSSSTASTMANDLGFDIVKKTNTNNPFKFISLVDNNSVLTAISNDIGYENVFLSQLKIHFCEGDYIIAISASGNSPNILKAVNFAKSNKGTVIGFIGFDGGKLNELCDCKIHIATNPGEYGPVEDAHLIINHILAHWFQHKLK